MRCRLQGLVLAAVAAFAQGVPLDLAGKFGELEVVVVDSLGHLVPQPRVVVEQIQGDRVVRRFPGERRMRLEAGTYRLAVETPGFRRSTRDITITGKPVLIVMGASVATLEAQANIPEVIGRVPNLDSRLKCGWVRLIPVFLDGPSLDATIQLNEYFAVENVVPGKYIAVVFGSAGTCRTAELTIRGWTRQHVIIDAPPGR